jgi:uncharacterized membrane protein (TIGR02234 family)
VRNERGLLLLAGAAGSVVALAAGAPTWVSGAVVIVTGDATVVADGRSAAPVATALALVSLAAVVASLLGRRLARYVAALVLVAGGAGVIASSVSVVTDPATALAAPARAVSGTTTVELDGDPAVAPWPVVSAAGGVLVVLAGAGTIVRARRWAAAPAGSARHERDASRTVDVQDDPAAAWDSLSHGDDPTR